MLIDEDARDVQPVRARLRREPPEEGEVGVSACRLRSRSRRLRCAGLAARGSRLLCASSGPACAHMAHRARIAAPADAHGARPSRAAAAPSGDRGASGAVPQAASDSDARTGPRSRPRPPQSARRRSESAPAGVRRRAPRAPCAAAPRRASRPALEVPAVERAAANDDRAVVRAGALDLGQPILGRAPVLASRTRNDAAPGTAAPRARRAGSPGGVPRARPRRRASGWTGAGRWSAPTAQRGAPASSRSCMNAAQCARRCAAGGDSETATAATSSGRATQQRRPPRPGQRQRGERRSTTMTTPASATATRALPGVGA